MTFAEVKRFIFGNLLHYSVSLMILTFQYIYCYFF